MKKYIVLFIIALGFIACKNSADNKTTTESPEATSPPVSTTSASGLLTGCYEYISDKNTIRFEITGVDNGVVGTLIYDFFEKDKNTGTFSGSVNGDHLFGTYTFRSEGMESSREVAFLINKNQLIEGYGELNAVGTAFVDKSKIAYNSNMPLTRGDCD